MASRVDAARDDDDALVAVGNALDHADARPRLVPDLLHYRAGLADHAAHLQGEEIFIKKLCSIPPTQDILV